MSSLSETTAHIHLDFLLWSSQFCRSTFHPGEASQHNDNSIVLKCAREKFSLTWSSIHTLQNVGFVSCPKRKEDTTVRWVASTVLLGKDLFVCGDGHLLLVLFPVGIPRAKQFIPRITCAAFDTILAYKGADRAALSLSSKELGWILAHVSLSQIGHWPLPPHVAAVPINTAFYRNTASIPTNIMLNAIMRHDG